MAGKSLELKVERTPSGHLRVELPSVPVRFARQQAYRRAAFRSDNDPQGIMRIIQVPLDMDRLIDEHLIGMRIDERFCKKHGVNEWLAYTSMPTEDRDGSYHHYYPKDIEYQALDMLLEASTQPNADNSVGQSRGQ